MLAPPALAEQPVDVAVRAALALELGEIDIAERDDHAVETAVAELAKKDLLA
jgi:hypothetical protein